MADASDNKSLLGPGGTQDTPSSDNSSSSSSSNFGYGALTAIGLIISALIFFGVVQKNNPELILYFGYVIKNFVGGTGATFLSFLPTIFLALGPLMDAINFEFQASKISIAGLGILFFQPLLGMLLKVWQKILALILGPTNTLEQPIPGLVSSFIDSCRVNAMGIGFPASGAGGTSNYVMIMLFISACYMFSMGLINLLNPGASFPQWYVGPSVMFGISILSSIIRILLPNNCDSFLSFTYGLSYAAIWTSVYFGIGYYMKQSILPFNNKIWGLGSQANSSNQDSQTGPNAKLNTTQSCASPQGDGVIYEIYQDGQMVGQV
jgi:hypothetical protein